MSRRSCLSGWACCPPGESAATDVIGPDGVIQVLDRLSLRLAIRALRVVRPGELAD